MQVQINELSKEVASLKTLQATQHAQNRSDIHSLRNGQQSMLDALMNGMEKIAEKIDKRLVPIEHSVRTLELKWAKAAGYAMAVAALISIVFKVVEIVFNHAIK